MFVDKEIKERTLKRIEQLESSRLRALAEGHFGAAEHYKNQIAALTAELPQMA